MKSSLVCILVVLIIRVHSLTNKEAMEYLKYYRHANTSNLHPKEYMEALKDFQRYAQISVTGTLDSATKKMMKTPRCFNPNRDEINVENRVRRYVLYGSKWNRRNLTYHIEYPPSIDRNVIDAGLKNAFDMWSRHTGLSFSKTGRIVAHIKMKFDYLENIGTLGYAYFPPNGIIVFNNRFTWTRDTYRGTNFYQTALHEIGHALGLRHSRVKGASLYPFLSMNPNFVLHSDDIEGIRALYNY